MKKENGIIIKGVGGFYYVETSDNAIYECRARGIFRKNKIKPYVGDRVTINLNDIGTCSIEEILQRKNELVRPPIANIDQLVIVASICDPYPSTVIIDKMIALSVSKQIEPVIIITKADLSETTNLSRVYDLSGIKSIEFSSVDLRNINVIKEILYGKVSAFTGNSGVGKSTLLNCINDNLLLETGDISHKLGRGKHTTRFVELFKIDGSTYVADTPGFSTVDIDRYELIKKDEIQFCFSEFVPYINNCKFTSCSHICEKGCAVIDALKNGYISRSRYDSYVYMYNEVKNIKEWEKR